MRRPAPTDTTRLDVVLRRRFPHLSRRDVQIAIASGMVTVNGGPGRKGSRVHPGDQIDAGSLLDPPAVPRDIEVPILYVDPAIMAIAKPPGIAATARRVQGKPSVAGYLLRHFPDLADAGASELEAGLVHRLDTDTSGILLAARSRAAWQNMRAQFRRRAVRKEYLALVHGHFPRPRRLTQEMAHDRRVRGRMVVLEAHRKRSPRRPERRWTATAAVHPVESVGSATLVRVELETGVTHQIRAQLAAAGHPVVGDRLYGSSEIGELQPPRHFLHAALLDFLHPIDQAPLILSCPVPPDFDAALRRLGFSKKAPAGFSPGGR